MSDGGWRGPRVVFLAVVPTTEAADCVLAATGECDYIWHYDPAAPFVAVQWLQDEDSPHELGLVWHGWVCSPCLATVDANLAAQLALLNERYAHLRRLLDLPAVTDPEAYVSDAVTAALLALVMALVARQTGPYPRSSFSNWMESRRAWLAQHPDRLPWDADPAA
jgi:hypothetical protein